MSSVGSEVVIVFLDYDGVVNNVIFEDGADRPQYCHPCDGRVNDLQAVKWVEMLCRETGAKIVVTSTWRHNDNYIDCLRNGGLNEQVEILGKTPRLRGSNRGAEIKQWLEESGLNIQNFVILDDDRDMEPLLDHLVQCDPDYGFGMREYHMALELLSNK